MVNGVRHPYDPNPRTNPHASLLRYGVKGANSAITAGGGVGGSDVNGIGSFLVSGVGGHFQHKTPPLPPLGMVGLGGPFGGAMRGNFALVL